MTSRGKRSKRERPRRGRREISACKPTGKSEGKLRPRSDSIAKFKRMSRRPLNKSSHVPAVLSDRAETWNTERLAYKPRSDVQMRRSNDILH